MFDNLLSPFSSSVNGLFFCMSVYEILQPSIAEISGGCCNFAKNLLQ